MTRDRDPRGGCRDDLQADGAEANEPLNCSPLALLIDQQAADVAAARATAG